MVYSSTERKPRVDIPERLRNKKPDEVLPLPGPELNMGKDCHKGQILGYKPEYGVTYATMTRLGSSCISPVRT